MTLTLELPDAADALAARAGEHGVKSEEYAQEVVRKKGHYPIYLTLKKL